MINRHHIMFNRREHEARGEYMAIREMPGLIPPIDVEAHNELHANVSFVPTIGYYAAVRVLAEYNDSQDYLQNVDNLLFALDRAANAKKAKTIERDLCRLAIKAVDMQRPFIKEGLHGS